MQQVRGGGGGDKTSKYQARKSAPAQPKEHLARHVLQARIQPRVHHRLPAKALILNPLKVKVLEVIPHRERALHGTVRDGGAIRALRDQHRELAPINELFDEAAAWAGMSTEYVG